MYVLPSFLFLRSPCESVFGYLSFNKTLTLTLWRFIFIGPAHCCCRAPRSSLVSLRLCLSPVISSCHRKACSFPQSFLNCFQEWIIVPSELPTGGFHEVSSLWVDFKSIYFPLLPFPPPLLLSHFVLLLIHFRSVSACKCCHWASVHWLRIRMKSKSHNLCKIISQIRNSLGNPPTLH